MKTATVTLKSTSPYSQSRPYEFEVAKLERETKDAYERRTWRSRCHVNTDGKIFIPPMSFKNCLDGAARYLSLQIPGQGKKTYTKKIEAGLMITDPLVLPVKADDVEGQWLYVNADGKRGGNTRVWRCFPLVNAWQGEIEIHVLDEIITKEVLEQHMEEAGKFIGIGRFRPENRGFFGRFQVQKLKWS